MINIKNKPLVNLQAAAVEMLNSVELSIEYTVVKDIQKLRLCIEKEVKLADKLNDEYLALDPLTLVEMMQNDELKDVLSKLKQALYIRNQNVEKLKFVNDKILEALKNAIKKESAEYSGYGKSGDAKPFIKRSSIMTPCEA